MTLVFRSVVLALVLSLAAAGVAINRGVKLSGGTSSQSGEGPGKPQIGPTARLRSATTSLAKCSWHELHEDFHARLVQCSF